MKRQGVYEIAKQRDGLLVGVSKADRSEWARLDRNEIAEALKMADMLPVLAEWTYACFSCAGGRTEASKATLKRFRLTIEKLKALNAELHHAFK